MVDPRDFRYDQKNPPPGLTPQVNPPVPIAPPTNVGAPTKLVVSAKEKLSLSPEQQKKRLLLLEEMKQTIADIVPSPSEANKEESSEQEENVITPDADQSQSSIDPYKLSLMEALGSPEMKSIRFGVIGTGQCGGRLAEQLFQFG